MSCSCDRTARGRARVGTNATGSGDSSSSASADARCAAEDDDRASLRELGERLVPLAHLVQVHAAVGEVHADAEVVRLERRAVGELPQQLPLGAPRPHDVLGQLDGALRISPHSHRPRVAKPRRRRQTTGGRPASVMRHTVRQRMGRRSPGCSRHPARQPPNHARRRGGIPRPAQHLDGRPRADVERHEHRGQVAAREPDPVPGVQPVVVRVPGGVDDRMPRLEVARVPGARGRCPRRARPARCPRARRRTDRPSRRSRRTPPAA